MADEEMEKFEITDYDLENEFNISRPRQRLSKHQHIYGIWSFENAEEEASSRSYGSFHRKDYTTPVIFVSGGIQQPGKKGEATTKKEGGVEKGFRTQYREDSVRSYNESREEGEFEEEEEHISVTSCCIASTSSDESENDSTLSRQCFSKEENFSKKSESRNEGEMAFNRRKNSFFGPSCFEKSVGSWVKHTKGIGAKLLLQMGYQPGKGLGKDLQGISAPVEAHQRKGRGSIGAYGPEKGIAKKTDGGEENNKKFVNKLSQWRREDTNKGKKLRYYFKSEEEILERGKLISGQKKYSQISKVKVIDMTGPEQRVLSGYHALAYRQRPSEEWEVRKGTLSNYDLPELQHNLTMLLDMYEQEIIDNNQRISYIGDQKITLKQEIITLENGIEQENIHIKALENILNIIESMIIQCYDTEEPMTLEKAGKLFEEIQSDYYEEYLLYDIGSLAVQIVAPLLKENLKSWNPLDNPIEPLGLFKYWKDMLETCGNSFLSDGTSQNLYHQLLWETWMPNVRKGINNWNCRSWETLIGLLEHWLPLIPRWILEHIREQLVLPRMQQEVEEWNPLTDTVPIHAWIHPWIPLLGDRLETTVYPLIRHKLSKALLNWHPSDRSAKLMLEPWRKVFAQGDMDAFLVKHILCKLQLCLQEFVINPHEQHLDHWNWVMDWESLLPVFSLAGLLERFFFPNWLQVLTLWLNSNPNYDAICTWYMGWKRMFSESLLAQPVIKEQFRKALDMMNQAVLQSGQIFNQTPIPMETASYNTNLEQVAQPQTLVEGTGSIPTETITSSFVRNSRYESFSESYQFVNQAPQGFKDLVQKLCEENDIVFVPIVNKYWEGKQIYRCGRFQVYIDRNVVFLSENGNIWRPASLNALLDAAV